MVNAALHRPERSLLAIGFVVIVLIRVGTNVFSQLLVVRFAQETVLSLYDRLCRRVLGTPFRTLEQIGPARVMTTLTDDVGTLSAALQSIPAVITNAAILLGCTIYLAWLSWTAAIVLTCLGLLGGAGYRALTRRAAGPINAARAEREVLFRHMRTLTEGIKELKMNQNRRYNFVEEDFTRTAQHLRQLNLSAMYHYLTADAWAQTMFFVIIGVMLFTLPSLDHIPIESLTGYAFVALYAMTPIWGFIGALPTFHRGEAALARIENLGLSLTQAASDDTPELTLQAPAVEIGFHNVMFTYEKTPTGAGGFTLGPINLTLHPGELVFIIGGNGSGKSTFVKLLTGLYPPDSGEITMNGQPLNNNVREQYRQQFSAVFSDFYLFETLAGLGGHDLDQKAQSYLRLLGLDDKVYVDHGVLSTTALSQGQRRRLALLAAYLEDRPVYVFDEWAADQDPVYRQIFYSKFLPELKALGKTVVVITHDDRYFYLGDRVIKLEYGKIVDTPPPIEPRPAGRLAGIEIDPL
jgi:putative ATP-binding cassette transporter